MLRTSLLAMGVCLLICGCGSKPADRPDVHPVRGRLLIGGQPTPGACVTLHALGNTGAAKFMPHGRVEPDGSFRLSTFNTFDGAPVGKYALCVVWPGPPPKGEGDDVDGPDRLRNIYADPKRPATQVEIARDTTELATIELKAVETTRSK
jgi:hypothetical protein